MTISRRRERQKMDNQPLLAGKPISQFYKLPFEKNSRILKLNVLESHTEFRAGRNPYRIGERKLVSFKKGILIIRVRLEKEPVLRVYLKVEYDHLLVSCSVDTDDSHLGRYAYRTLRAMLWDDFHDFGEYYWPECFNSTTGRSRYLHVVCDRYGIDIKLREAFSGFFRPNDYFIDISERTVLKREAPVKVNKVPRIDNYVGYCLADTDSVKFHSNHYPFLIPYTFTKNADNRTIRSYGSFLFEDEDRQEMYITPAQNKLNRIYEEMKQIVKIRFGKYGDSEERIQEIADSNLARKRRIFELFNKALPMLSEEPFTHYFFTHGLNNIQHRPKKKYMEIATFSTEIPTLTFFLTDKGEYYELKLKFRVKGKSLILSEEKFATFFISSLSRPNVWYLMESEMDCTVVSFFSRTNFGIQIPKGYYGQHFEKYVDNIKKYYELVIK